MDQVILKLEMSMEQKLKNCEQIISRSKVINLKTLIKIHGDLDCRLCREKRKPAF